MNEEIIGIYKITSPSKRVYIGQSINCKVRKERYKKSDCKGQRRLYNSIKKYGWENHTFEVIEECDINSLNERERFWQEYHQVLDNSKGLNCLYTKTNDKSGKVSESTRERLRKRPIRKFSESEWSEERRKKASESMRKRMTGFKISEETRKKLSDFHKGRLSLGKNHQAVKVINTETNRTFSSIKSAWIELYKDKWSYDYFKNMVRGINKNKTPIEVFEEK